MATSFSTITGADEPEQLLWVRYFATIEELRLALLEFMEKYNGQWLIGKHDYRTPAQVRADFEAEFAA